MKKAPILLITIICLLVFGCIQPNENTDENQLVDININLNNLDFGIAFPPLNDQQKISFSINALNELNIEKVRFYANWYLREPNKGEFNWNQEDLRFKELKDANKTAHITFNARGPDWACDPLEIKTEDYCKFKDSEDFRKFVHAYLEKYSDIINGVDFTNAINWTFLSENRGSVEEYIKLNNILYEEAKKINPNLIVSLGSVTSGTSTNLALIRSKLLNGEKIFSNFDEIDEILSVCHDKTYSIDPTKAQDAKELYDKIYSTADYDAIDIHLYDDFFNWEMYEVTWREYLQSLGRDYNTIIISTEFGGPHFECEEETNETFQAKRLIQYLETISRMNLKEAYYFQMVECGENRSCAHKYSGLYKTRTGVYLKKKTFDIFKSVMNPKIN